MTHYCSLPIMVLYRNLTLMQVYRTKNIQMIVSSSWSENKECLQNKRSGCILSMAGIDVYLNEVRN